MNAKSNRLTLRPMTIDDATALYSYRSIPEVNTFTYTQVWTSMDEAIAHIEKLLPEMDKADSGFGKWMVVRNDTSDVIGDVFLNRTPEMTGTYEIGYIIHPNHAGNGFATEAARMAMKIAFEDWGAHRIYARVDEEHVVSARVCKKLGMRQEARLIENDKRGDMWTNELIFAILDREWAEMHGDKS